MNALTLLVIALLVYALAYRYYASFIIAKILVFDKDRPTPASSGGGCFRSCGPGAKHNYASL